MHGYKARTGVRLTYAALSEMTGMSRSNLVSIATRPGFNTTLRTIDRLCVALDCTPADLLEFWPSSVRVRKGRA